MCRSLVQRSRKFLIASSFALAPDVSEKLQALGFSSLQANSFAVVMHDTIEGEQTEGFERGSIKGFQTGGGYIDVDEQDNWTSYRLAAHVLAGHSLRRTNHIILHELAHALLRPEREAKGKEISYRDERKVRIAERIGKVLLPGVTTFAKHALWYLSLEERRCEHFARKNRHVQLIVDKNNQTAYSV